MHWTYDDVLTLPAYVYDVLIDELSKNNDEPE
jgi:hypothetical protein